VAFVAEVLKSYAQSGAGNADIDVAALAERGLLEA